MADYFDQQPNFTNPGYATPEQLANQRAYADALTKRSGEDVNRPAGALANMITALSGVMERNRANQIQSQAAGQNSSDVSALIAQLQSGQKIDPAPAAHLYANPMASPEARALVGKLITPEAIQSAYGQPAYQSPAQGVQAAPVQGALNPAYRVEQGAEGVHSNAPFPAPTVQPPRPNIVPGGMFGGTSKPVGWDQGQVAPQGSGGPQAGAGSPPAPPAVTGNAAGGYAGPMSLDALAAKGREFAAQKAFTQGGAEASTNIQREDISAAANAPVIKRVAGTMLDDLRTHGDKMTFGPTAEWSNTIKRAAANYAPGLMKDQLTSLRIGSLRWIWRCRGAKAHLMQRLSREFS